MCLDTTKAHSFSILVRNGSINSPLLGRTTDRSKQTTILTSEQCNASTKCISRTEQNNRASAQLHVDHFLRSFCVSASRQVLLRNFVAQGAIGQECLNFHFLLPQRACSFPTYWTSLMTSYGNEELLACLRSRTHAQRLLTDEDDGT
jgi:hypothetical protein